MKIAPVPSPSGNARRAIAILLGLAAVALVAAVAVGVVVAGVLASRHLAALGTAVAGTLALLLASGLAFSRLGRRLPRRFVVAVDLSRLPAEAAPSPLARIAGRDAPLDLASTIEVLGRLAADKRVAGVVVDAGLSRGGIARIQELRDALQRVRAAGKFTVAYADTFGELQGGNAGYYLASACEEVVLQPGGSVGLVGIAREANFLAGALARLGVEAVFEGRHEYKSAADQLLRDRLSEPDREQRQRLVDSQLDQIVRGIASGRHLPAEEIRSLVERGPFLGPEALEAGLVDRIAHADEVEEQAKARAGAKADLVSLPRYSRTALGRGGRGGRAAKVALVTATGPIVRRAASPLPAPGGQPLDAQAIAGVIRRAAQSRGIRAILLRIDSPGGSAVASETIHRALVRARASGTPVVVSMGDVAASGGYYIAVAGDRIVAQPGTLTGSIGVIAGKLVVAGAKARLGVTTDEVHAGAHALIDSANRTFSSSEHERFSAGLDAVYDIFLSRVAEGRQMKLEQVHAVAKGRIWTGEDARSVGLVDVLGGVSEALEELRRILGLPAGARLRLVRPHRRKDLAGLLSAGRASAGGWLAALTAGVASTSAPLRMPPGTGSSEIA